MAVVVLWLLVLGGGLPPAVQAANTPGIATFTVRTKTYNGNYGPKNVMAIWVADANTNFVLTVKRQASSQINELDRWNAARAGNANVDGTAGSTISSHTTHTVYWRGTNTAGAVLADGTYNFMIEFSEHETTTSNLGKLAVVPFTKGPTGFTNSPAALTYFDTMQVLWTPSPPDVAVVGVTPLIGNPNTTIPLRVTVTNRSDNPASFTVSVTNVASTSLIGTYAVSSLPMRTATNVTVQWNTAGLTVGTYALRAHASPVAGEISVADNTLAVNAVLRDPTHDLAVAGVVRPALIRPGTTTNISVIARNTGDFTETFSVLLMDETDNRLIGSNRVSSLAAGASNTVVLAWNTTGASVGFHDVQAAILPVIGEGNTGDNTNFFSVPVANGLQTNVLVAAASTWRYQDGGLNLTATPWRSVGYFDQAWAAGKAPLGYSDNATHTNITTAIGYGPDAANKYPTAYFRQRFMVDVVPSILNGRLRRDDGVVLYLNGVEFYRVNMPATGPMSYTNWATVTVSGNDQYTYFTFTTNESALVLGENVLAAEVHQSVNTSSDLVFDLELTGVAPLIPPVRDLAVSGVGLEPGSHSQVHAGDSVPVQLVLTNRGNQTETFTVYLRNTNNGLVVASQTISNFVPRSSLTVDFAWASSVNLSGDQGLQAYVVVGGVTNFAAPFLVSFTSAFDLRSVTTTGSLGGRCTSLGTNGNILVVGTGARLELYDRSNPAAPTLVGALRLPGLVEDVVVKFNHAFVACGSAGVQIVDISTPAAPVHRHTFQSAGHAYDLAFYGNYLCVADGEGGVRFLNVSTPATPLLVGGYRTEGPARSVAVLNNNAYVVDQLKGLYILGIANPASPTLAGTYTNFTAGKSIKMVGFWAYVLDDNAQLRVINCTSALTPVLTNTIVLGGVAEVMASSGPNLYIAAGDAGIYTLSVSSQANPVFVSTNATPGPAVDVFVAGTQLYAACGLAGFQTYSIATPAAPVSQGLAPVGGRPLDAALLPGNYAVVAGGEAGLQIYHLANPALPALKATCTDLRNARCVALAGTLACVGDGQYGLKLVSLADPLNPVLTGSLVHSNLGFVRALAVEGARAVATDGARLCLVNIANPAAPVLLAVTVPPAFVHGLALVEGKVLAACGGAGLVTWDITGNQFALLGGYDTPGFASSVAVANRQAYVADGGAGWLILDVANAAAPTLISASSAQGSVHAVAVSGPVAVVTGQNQATSLDVSVPLTPVSRQAFGPLTRALRVTTGGAYALVAEDEAGLAVLTVGSADTDNDGLPDAWEQQVVDANPADNIQTIQDVRPGDDFDHDGFSNLQEYLAGTSPVDAQSVFALGTPSAGAGQPATLRWHSVEGKLYTVYKSTNLKAGFTVLQDNVPATAPLNVFTDPAPADNAFYVIGVK